MSIIAAADSIFSTYRTGENRVTASTLAVLRSLALHRTEGLLGAFMERSEGTPEKLAGASEKLYRSATVSSRCFATKARVRCCQVDVERSGSAADKAMTPTSDTDTRHLTPEPEGTGAQQAMVDGSQEVTAETKQIQHDAMHRQETLRVRGGGEPPQMSLALAGRLARHLRSIVLVLPRVVNH